MCEINSLIKHTQTWMLVCSQAKKTIKIEDHNTRGTYHTNINTST